MSLDPHPSDTNDDQATPASDANAPTIILTKPTLDANAPTIILTRPAFDANAATMIMGKSIAPVISISTERVGDFIGRYQLIEELGVGGFGIVWRAEQFEPIHREVALKVIKPGMDSREIIARFEAERQALALMDHPNIAGVLDAGATDNGRPYFVMELVKGVPVTEYCDERKLTIRQRLELFIPVCQAVQHAHQKAILHRDLKPGNILVAEVDGKPVPKVIDFGIAKALGTSPDDAFESDLARTQEGVLVGTPQYMSPEQAGMGADMDTRSDIYMLGVILYELLTGSTPLTREALRKAGFDEVLRLIREVESVRPSNRMMPVTDIIRQISILRGTEPAKLSRSLRGDLDWITLKALEKERERRYESASSLAQDLERHLNNEPVEAGPPSTLYRLHKLVRRNRLAFAAAAAIAVLLVAGIGVSTWQAIRASRAESLARQRLADVQIAQQQTIKRLKESARSDWVFARDLLVKDRKRDAFAYLARSCENDPDSASAAETSALALSDWNSPPSLATLNGHAEMVRSAQFSADGKRMVTASNDRTARIWDVTTGALLITLDGHKDVVCSAQFSADGSRVVTASFDRTSRVWSSEDGKLLATLKGHSGVVNGAQFNNDGTRVVTSSEDHTARLWDAASGALLATLQDFEYVWSAQFSADGRRIVNASGDGMARVWDAADGKLLVTLQGHEAPVRSAQFSPDGSRIMTSSDDKTARVWDSATGKLLITLQGHEASVRSAQFSADGSRIVTASEDKTARLWEAATGDLQVTLKGHERGVVSAQFSADGRRIVTASSDRTARVWESGMGRLLAVFHGHEGAIRSAQFSADGSRIVTASEDKTARVWAVTGGLLAILRGHENKVWGVQFSTDGRQIVSASMDKTARVWEAATGRLVSIIKGHERVVSSAQFSMDGKRVVTASNDNSARVWDSASGKQLAILEGHDSEVSNAQFSADGSRIVTAANDNTARVWDSASGKQIVALEGHEGWVHCAQFNAKGSRIVTASNDNTARVWNAATGKLLATLEGHQGWLQNAQFSANGSRIVTASNDNTARVWDTSNGKLLSALEGHDREVNNAQFSSDGRYVVTASNDKTARVWDAVSGKLIATLIGHQGAVNSARFNADGSRIVTASNDNTARVWETSSGKQLATITGHDSFVLNAQFSPDGHRLVTCSTDGTVRVWELVIQKERVPDWWPEFLKAISLRQLNDDGELADVRDLEAKRHMTDVRRGIDSEPSRLADIAHWFLTRPEDKTIRPGDPRSAFDVADSLITPDAIEGDLERSYEINPAHPLIQLALARYETDLVRARHLRDYSIKRIAAKPTPELEARAAVLIKLLNTESK